MRNRKQDCNVKINIISFAPPFAGLSSARSTRPRASTALASASFGLSSWAELPAHGNVEVAILNGNKAPVRLLTFPRGHRHFGQRVGSNRSAR